MINFFRGIRQRLLKDGYTQRYAVYAIGEILLVMVGILLALQVNNWNEDRVAKKIEREYLIGLQEEFKINLETLHEFMSLNEAVIATCKAFLEHTSPDYDYNTSNFDEISHFRDLLRSNVEYEPSPGIMEDLISSGNLSKLTNVELRKELSNWKAILALVKRQENTVLEYRSNIKNLLIDYGNTRRPITDLIGVSDSRFENDSRQLLRDHRFENNISFMTISSISLNEHYYTRLKKINEAILEIIQGEI